ncbi:MAG: TIM barrel protein [Woeseiaceae bacterium]
MSVTLGVTLYSMTNEWLAGRFTLPQLVDEVGKCKLGPGVELIGFQSLRGFPNRVSAKDLKELRDAIDRNELVPTSLASNADVARNANAWMTTDESVEYMRPQIELAGKLGFPVVRTQIGLTPDVLEKLEPIAAKAKVHLGMEVHAPEGPNTAKVQATREVYERIDSEWLGFIPDFSSCMRAIPPGMLDTLRRDGLSEAGIEALVRAWESPGPPFARYGAFADEAKAMGEPALPIGAATLVFTMFGRENPEDWRELLPQVRHIHGKFYDVDDDLVSPSIDYETLMHVFGESDTTFTMSTEWEGHAYLDMDEQDAFDIVARHHAMCRKFLG